MASEQDLIKAARALDQSGPETVASKLQRLWSALVATTPTIATATNDTTGHFHAAEEVALRWLLKTMHATGKASAETETLRRWPLTWRILATVFRRMPLFSLAKSLADRRFVAVLQQTARDVATPGKTLKTSKRKQTPEDVFELSALSTPQSCVASAAALFEALGALLARLSTISEVVQGQVQSPYDHIGAEHIKSLFSVPATDALVLLQPLLEVSRLALTLTLGDSNNDDNDGDDDNNNNNGHDDDNDGQDTWLTTVASLWDLHMQGPTDAFDVASQLSTTGLAMIGQLMEKEEKESRGVNHVNSAWLASLRRFFTNNLVLPARSVFLNRGDLQAVSAMTSSLVTAARDLEQRLGAFYALALGAPRLVAGGGASSRDNERWLQAVFETMRAAAMAPSGGLGVDEQAALLAKLMRQATASSMSTSPSVASLRQVCDLCLSSSSSSPVKANADVLAAVAACDTDVFLRDDEGTARLDRVLQQMSSVVDGDSTSWCDFLIALAKGYASSRRLPDFITRWLSGIADVKSTTTTQTAWLDVRLRDAVATLLATLTEEQILALVAQVEGSHGGDGDADDDLKHKVARLVVFEAITAGLRLDSIQDAVGMRMLNDVLVADLLSSSSKTSVKLPSAVLAVQWRLIRQTLAWAGFDDAERVWAQVKKLLKRMASKKKKKEEEDGGGVLTWDRFEAFRCCFALWMALRFGGDVETEARDMTWAFFHRVQEAVASSLTAAERTALIQRAAASRLVEGSVLDAYMSWMLVGSSQFIDADEPSSFLRELVASSEPAAGVFNGIAAGMTSVVVANGTALENHAVSEITVDSNVKSLENAVAVAVAGRDDLSDALLGLLRTPLHLLQRSHRERIVSALLPSPSPSENTPSYSLDDYTMMLDLLLRVTQKRSFGPDFAFDRVVHLGTNLAEMLRRRANKDDKKNYVTLYRFTRVAAAYFRSTASKDARIPDESQQVTPEVRVALLGAQLSSTDAAQRDTAKEALASFLSAQLPIYLGFPGEQARSKKKEKNKKKKIETEPADALPVDLRLAVDAAMAANISPLGYPDSAVVVGTLKARFDAALVSRPKVGWLWAGFLARFARGQAPRHVHFPGLFRAAEQSDAVDQGDAADPTQILLELDGVLLRQYLESETADYDADAVLSYMDDIVASEAGPDADPADAVGQLLAVRHLLARLLDMDLPGDTTKTTDGRPPRLGIVHSKLAQQLPHARSATECRLLTQICCTLLADDRAAAAMGQWNVDAALHAAALVAAGHDGGFGRAVAFDAACLLVEAVLKRHRVRLEGRFHQLAGTLQALLACLAAGHQDELRRVTSSDGGSDADADANGSNTDWARQAKRFSRLLELVCEPSTAAVTLMSARKSAGSAGGAPNPLHSATDAAKRSAGQHMYLVLMTYIHVQIMDGAVLSRRVREALEPGLFSVVTITPEETRRGLNDAVDAGGRALFKDLYRRWLQFGKWRGV